MPLVQSVFLAGDIWALFVPEHAAMLGFGVVFFAATVRATQAPGSHERPRRWLRVGRNDRSRSFGRAARPAQPHHADRAADRCSWCCSGSPRRSKSRTSTIGVYDRDHGGWSQEIVQRLAGSPNVRRIVRLGSPRSGPGCAIDSARRHRRRQLRPRASRPMSRRGGRRRAGDLSTGAARTPRQIVGGYIAQIVGGCRRRTEVQRRRRSRRRDGSSRTGSTRTSITCGSRCPAWS